MTIYKTLNEAKNELTTRAFKYPAPGLQALAIQLQAAYNEIEQDPEGVDLGTLQNLIADVAAQLGPKKPGKTRQAWRWVSKFLNWKDGRAICAHFFTHDGYLYANNGHVSARIPVSSAPELAPGTFYDKDFQPVESSAILERGRDAVIATWERYTSNQAAGDYKRAVVDTDELTLVGRFDQYTTAAIIPDGCSPGVTDPNYVNARYLLQAMNADRGPVMIPRWGDNADQGAPLYVRGQHGEALIMPVRQ